MHPVGALVWPNDGAGKMRDSVDRIGTKRKQLRGVSAHRPLCLLVNDHALILVADSAGQNRSTLPRRASGDRTLWDAELASSLKYGVIWPGGQGRLISSILCLVVLALGVRWS